jgi:hypothetical protein
MNKLRVAFFVSLAIVGGAFSYKGAALAATDDTIYNYLSGEVNYRIQRLQGLVERVEQTILGRFDTIDTKLDRIYAACGGTPTPTRRVTSAQALTCINACFTSTAAATMRNGQLNNRNGAIDSDRFVACVSRCPSVTLRNQECAQRYVRNTEGGEQVQSFGQYTMLGHTRDGFTRICTDSHEERASNCQAYADSLVNGLASCLTDQRAYTCQQDCDGSFRNPEGYAQCMLLCNNRTRATEIYNGLRESGFINEQGRLGVSTETNTSIAPLAPTPTPAATPTPVPSEQTYTQCVYGCDTERSACLVQAPTQPQLCQTTYDRCYLGCSARLLPGRG